MKLVYHVWVRCRDFPLSLTIFVPNLVLGGREKSGAVTRPTLTVKQPEQPV